MKRQKLEGSAQGVGNCESFVVDPCVMKRQGEKIVAAAGGEKGGLAKPGSAPVCSDSS